MVFQGSRVLMPKPISRRKLIQKLSALGFVGPFSGGRHQFMERKDFRIAIPNPHGQDIGARLLQQILHELGISSDEFDEL